MIKDIFEDDPLFKQNIPIKQRIKQKQNFKTLKLIEEDKKNYLKNNWTLSDQIKLIELHNSLGNKWSEIAKILKKSDNAVKNYFHSKLRKGLRRLNRKAIKILKGDYRVFKTTIISKIVQTIQEQSLQQKKFSKDLLLLCFQMKNKLYQEANKKQIDLLQMSSLLQTIRKLNYINKALKKKPRRYQKLTISFKKKPRKFQKVKQKKIKKNQFLQICENKNLQDHDKNNNLKTSIEIEQFLEYNQTKNIQQQNMQQVMSNYFYFQNFNINGYYFVNIPEEIINYQPYFIYYNYQYFQKYHQEQNLIHLNYVMFPYNSSPYYQFIDKNKENQGKSDYFFNSCTFLNNLDYYN